MKILIADDDKEIVELLSIYVHNEGYEAVKAYDGKEALSKIRTIPDIELLILDIMMPEMDGMQVVKELRKESQIPIIMLTAKTTDMGIPSFVVYQDGKEIGRLVNKDRKTKDEVENFLRSLD